MASKKTVIPRAPFVFFAIIMANCLSGPNRPCQRHPEPKSPDRQLDEWMDCSAISTGPECFDDWRLAGWLAPDLHQTGNWH